jgi:hypothetical protein
MIAENVVNQLPKANQLMKRLGKSVEFSNLSQNNKNDKCTLPLYMPLECVKRTS